MAANAGERRSIGQMPYLRRQDGLSAIERREERALWTVILALAVAVAQAPPNVQVVVLPLLALLAARATALRVCAWAAPPPIDKTNDGRGIASFSEFDCWRLFRFRKEDLPALVAQLLFPAVLAIKGDKNGHVSGEYAGLYLMHRLRYPGVLADCQHEWGREYSQCSKLFNTALDLMFLLHANKVRGNVAWYQDLFDGYNRAISSKLLEQGHVQNLNLAGPGQLPQSLSELFGFLDCTANEICRPGGPNPIQNAFYNGYHHGHFIIWQGVSFPDGMVVIEGPEPGYKTDTMVWASCLIRHQLEAIMQSRLADNPPRCRLKLYADKIYNTSPLVTAAWSLRHGPIAQWMTDENWVMSKIRVAIEWTFGSILMLFKFVDFAKGQKLFESPLEKQYVVTVLLANCHNCLYGDTHAEYFKCDPPTLADYLSQ